MKKFLLFLALLIIVPSAANSYQVTITDPAGDQIGDQNFDTFFITYTVGNPMSITIGTNYAQNGLLVGGWQTLPADLLLDGSANGSGWDYAIPLVNHGGFTAGNVYEITSLYLSDDLAPSTGSYIYNHNVPVWLETGIYTGGSGIWKWNSTGGDNPTYNIASLNLNWYWNDENGTDKLKMGWATATCANDTIGVPEPTMTIMLGGLLLGIGALGRRQFLKR